jgi:secreted PhoX family phosphatase
MSITRRDFLLLLLSSAGAVGLNSLVGCEKKIAVQPTTKEVRAAFAFQPIQGPIPLETAGFRPEQQKEQYSAYEVRDDLVLPQGYQYQVIAAWGDKVGDSRFGYNNDYLSFVPTGNNEGYLSVNFEYISAIPWMQTYEQVIGKSLPFDEVKAALKENKSGKNEINAFSLADSNPIKAKIREISKEALLDQGLGIISIRKTGDGKWKRTNSQVDRRISGISGLEDRRYLKATGLAVAVFRKQQELGYVDNLLLDNNGNVWILTDMSTTKMNKSVKSRTNDKGKPANLSGLFGNNALWYIPTSGDDAGKAFLFSIGPMECETTGPCFAPEQQSMFFSIQHLGEANGTRKNQASEAREFLITTTIGKEFLQSRQVPIGSNWPSKNPDASPKPAVVAISKS